MKNLFKNFIIREKEIVIDCFTYLPYAYDFAKIDHAINYIPEWWQKMPSILDKQFATIKHCPAFKDFYKKGIVIPSWFEMNLNINKAGENDWFSWEASSSDISTNNSHSSLQFSGFAQEKGRNIKITSPWIFDTKADINWVWSKPTWNMQDYVGIIEVLPGVVNFKYNKATEINLFVQNKENVQHVNIPALTPLVILHPMTEKKITLKNHLVDEKEWNRILYGITNLLFKRSSIDVMRFWNKKKKLLSQIEKIRCPYNKKDF